MPLAILYIGLDALCFRVVHLSERMFMRAQFEAF